MSFYRQSERGLYSTEEANCPTIFGSTWYYSTFPPIYCQLNSNDLSYFIYNEYFFYLLREKQKCIAPWQYNMLNLGAGGRALTWTEYLSGKVIIMSTYEKLSLIVSIALLVAVILNLKKRNSSPNSGAIIFVVRLQNQRHMTSYQRLYSLSSTVFNLQTHKKKEMPYLSAFPHF